AHHHRADAELAHQPAAVPARRERGDHDRVAVGALPAGLAEGVGLPVHARVVVLYAPVAAAPEQGAVGAVERGADRDPTLGQARAGLVDRGPEHGAEIGVWSLGGHAGSSRGAVPIIVASTAAPRAD